VDRSSPSCLGHCSDDWESPEQLWAVRSILQGGCQVIPRSVKGLVLTGPPKEAGRNVIDFALVGHVRGTAVLAIVSGKLIPCEHLHAIHPLGQRNDAPALGASWGFEGGAT